MTQLQHIAWYNLVIANVYAVGGKEVPFIAFPYHRRALFWGGLF
jgi:hypothetical protein